MTPISKRIIKIALILWIVVVGLGSTQPVLAEGEQEDENTEEQLGSFKEDGKSYYHLDSVPKDLNEEENFMDNITSNLWFLDSNEITQKMNEMFNYLANIAFDLNILMTNFMIFSLDFAYDFNFINTIIEKLNGIMGEITGITSEGYFSGSGIFGNLAIFAAVFAVIYAAFLMIWKRSMFASIGTILQTVIALTIAILLFTNYSTFLTGLNQVTTQASSLILAGNSQESDTDGGAQPIESGTPTNLDENSLKDGMKDNIWALFVDRPYLYMMYGETSLTNLAGSEEEAIDRVNHILKEQPNSEARYAAISNELTAHQNDYLLYDNISTRLSFTPMYLTINGIVSLPIYFLALALLIFQFWFMLIAIFAPFALLFGAIPGQFGVVKRYFIELGLPLILKIVVSFVALVIFAISDLLYEADFMVSDSSNPFIAYIAAALIHFVMFMLIFLLRKRIQNIFSAGSQGVQELREGMGDFTKPLKKGVQGAGTVAGSTVGAVATGGAGAIAGMSVGSSLGKAATGEGSAGDVAKSGMHAHRSHQMASLKKTSYGSVPEGQQVNQLSDQGAENIGSFLESRNVDTHSADDVMDTFDQKGVEHASLDDLNTAHDDIVGQAEEDEKLTDDYAKLLANRVKQQKNDRELNKQYQQLSRLQDSGSRTQESQKQVFPKSSKSIDDLPDMHTRNRQPVGEIPTGSIQKTPLRKGQLYGNDISQGKSLNAVKVIPNKEEASNLKHETTATNTYRQQLEDNEKDHLISLDKTMSPEANKRDVANENKPNDGYTTLD